MGGGNFLHTATPTRCSIQCDPCIFSEVGKIKSEAQARESHLGRASEEAEFFKREAARLEQQLNDASREVERLAAVEREKLDRAGEKEGLMLQLQAKDQELEHYKAEVARWACISTAW